MEEGNEEGRSSLPFTHPLWLLFTSKTHLSPRRWVGSAGSGDDGAGDGREPWKRGLISGNLTPIERILFLTLGLLSLVRVTLVENNSLYK